MNAVHGDYDGVEDTAPMPLSLETIRQADLNLLIYYVVLAEEQSVSAAALRLHLTQSALSKALQRLRSQFADELLIRTDGHYKPTARGQELLRGVKALLPELHKLLSGREFDPSIESVQFKLIVPDSLTYFYGSSLAMRLSEFPGVSLSVAAFNEHRYEELQANRCDLVLDADSTLLPRGLLKEVLFEDSFVCVVSSASPYTRRLTLAQYLGGEHLAISPTGDRQPIPDRALAKLGLSRKCVMSVPYFGAALRIVAESHLIATLSRRMCEAIASRGSVRFLKPPKELDSLRYIMVWHERQDKDARNVWLRALLQSATKQLMTRKRLTSSRTAARPSTSPVK